MADGDYAVVALESIAGVEGEPVKQDEMVLEIGGADTFEAFSSNLRGLSPGDEKEFEVTYPEDYGSARLSGKTVTFHATLKGIRKKELPELNDEFAQDLGDYRNVEELRDAVRKGIFGQRQYEAQQEAKNKIVDQLVDSHDFPVPEVFVERQIQNRVEQSLRSMAAEGIDPRSIKLDWQKVKESQRDKAVARSQSLHAALQISEREAIHATRDEVDKEVERHCPAEPRTGGGGPDEIRKRRYHGTYRLPHSNRENAQFPVRACPEDCLIEFRVDRTVTHPYESRQYCPNQPSEYIAKEARSGDNRNEIVLRSLPRRQPGF